MKANPGLSDFLRMFNGGDIPTIALHYWRFFLLAVNTTEGTKILKIEMSNLDGFLSEKTILSGELLAPNESSFPDMAQGWKPIFLYGRQDDIANHPLIGPNAAVMEMLFALEHVRGNDAVAKKVVDLSLNRLQDPLEELDIWTLLADYLAGWELRMKTDPTAAIEQEYILATARYLLAVAGKTKYPFHAVQILKMARYIGNLGHKQEDFADLLQQIWRLDKELHREWDRDV